MSEELDRRVAVEVMGEEEPEEVTEDEWGNVYLEGERLQGATEPFVFGAPAFSPGGNWQVVRIYQHGDIPEWKPRPFSTDFAVAMRAVDKVSDTAWLVLNYHNTDAPEWSATFSVLCHRLDVSKEEKCRIERATLSDAPSAPEVICRALLAYVERKK